MRLTRDSIAVTVTFFSTLTLFVLANLGTVHTAFPTLDTVWDARVSLISGLLAAISGFLKMSPLPLSHRSPLAGTSDPTNTLTPLGQPKAEDKL